MTLIGMPCFNRCEFTSQAIQSIAATTPRASYRLVCVNDGSTDDTARVLRDAKDAGMVDDVVTHSAQLGIAKSMNDAWKIGESNAQFFVKIDNDIRFLQSGWLAAMQDVLTAFPKIGLSAIQIEPLRGNKKVLAANGLIAIRPRSNVNGACFMATRRAFDALGYFYEGFSRQYGYADADYCLRSRYAGMDHLYLREPVGYWATQMDDGDRDYKSWKWKQRMDQRGQWRQFVKSVNSRRLSVYQPYTRG